MKYILTILILLFTLPSFSAQYTSGYTKKNGTYVKPYYRTNPNKYKFDNYSLKYNYNPTTNKRGTVDPYKQKRTK